MNISKANTEISTPLRLVPNRSQKSLSEKSEAGVDEYVLFRLIVEGDASAFEVFYKIYYPRLFRFILRVTRDPDFVEELIQETLLVIWKRPDRFKYQSKLSTWIFGIAYNKALKAMSKNAKHKSEVNVDDLLDVEGDEVSLTIHSWENEDWLNTALGILTPDQRAVIELTFYHELNYQEIAKILDCPENTVKTCMFHARKKLKNFASNQ